MLRRLLPLAIMAALTVLAADQPKLAGTWKLNIDKSDFGPSPMKPEKFDRKIEQTGAEMKVTTTQAMGGQERTTDVSYTVDGKEHVVKVGNGEAKVTASYTADGCKVLTVREMQGMELKVEETWKLSDGGKGLTVDAVIKTPQGDFNMKMVMEKQ